MSTLETLFPAASKRNRRAIYALTLAQIKVRYRKSIAGFLWVALNPLLLFGVQSYIFKNILKIQIDNYLLFLASGLIPWSTLIISIESGIPLLYNSRELLKNFPINPFILISSHVIDSFIAITSTFIITLIIVSIFSSIPYAYFLSSFPIAYLLFFIGMWHIIAILSVINIFLRDTRFVASFVHQFLFFLTPIFYPVHLLPSPINIISQYTPYYILIAPIRASLYQSQDPQAFSFLHCVLVAVTLIIILRLILNFIWKKANATFYFKL